VGHVGWSWAQFMEAAGGIAVGRGAPGVRNGQREAQIRAALDRVKVLGRGS
jgi:ABC-type sugar transport system substrate-binding protein